MRTTPVSVSTETSATWQPPTCPLDTLGLSGSLAIWPLHMPVPLASSMPSLAQNSFHDQLLLLAESTTLPSWISRLFASAPTLPATFLNRSSRAALAARSVAGACDGSVVLPPEPDDWPRLLSPILTWMSSTLSPRISAVTMAETVRCPVPRSWVDDSTDTEPSRLMTTVASFGPAAKPPQVCTPMPMPRLTVPLPPCPGGCHFFAQPDFSAARSNCLL